MDPKESMRLAIEAAKKGIKSGQTPFGAVILSGGQVVASEHNTVWKDRDPTAHAEVNAIRAASRSLATIDLSGAVMYSTCEPCPMCLSAIHWAKLDCVYYGASIEDAARAGFSELTMPAEDLARLGGSSLVVSRGPLQSECRRLFQLWKEAQQSDIY